MIDFSKNKWKYSTIGLLAVLAIGFSFPQASAHVTTSLTHNVAHIMDALIAIRGEVEDLPSKAYGSRVINEAVTISEDGITATSDKDFTLCYVLSNPFDPAVQPVQMTITITQGEKSESHLWFVQGGRQTDSACLGADAGGTIEFETQNNSIFGFVTLTTSADAEASIIEPEGE